MKLLLIRHGQSANNVLAESDGHDYEKYMATRVAEPPLSAIGHEQAERLAAYMAEATAASLAANAEPPAPAAAWMARELPLDVLYVSPMLRALQTAQPLAAALGLTPQVWVDIHEHGGIFTGSTTAGTLAPEPGLSAAAIAAQFPGYQVGPGIDERGWWWGGYEEMDVCHQRAKRVAARLLEMAEETPDARIALVSHGTFLDALLHALILPNEPYGERMHFSHLNTAYSRVDFRRQAYVPPTLASNPQAMTNQDGVSPDGANQDGANRDGAAQDAGPRSDIRLVLRYLNRIDHLPRGLVTR